MSVPGLELVPLDRHHMDRTAPVLAEAFAEDPGTLVVIKGDRDKRLRLLSRNYAAQMDLNLPQGVSKCALLKGEIVGGAIISAPGRGTVTNIGMLKVLCRMLIPAGPAVLWRAVQNVMDDEKHRPKEPNYFLETLGVDPRHHGLGIGSALLLDLVEQADRERVLVYLTTTQPKAVPLYERFGFETKSRTMIFGVPNRHMVRKPRKS